MFGLNLGGGSSLFGNNANKPNTLFGGTTTGSGLFGSSGFGSTSNPTFGASSTGLGGNLPMGSLLGGYVLLFEFNIKYSMFKHFVCCLY